MRTAALPLLLVLPLTCHGGAGSSSVVATSLSSPRPCCFGVIVVGCRRRNADRRRRCRCILASSLFGGSGDENDDNDVDMSTSKSRRRRRRRDDAHDVENSAAVTTSSTALCVVPPSEAWDALQRARHLARDATFYRWPPALRLFHPFLPRSDLPEATGRIAEFVEANDITPFDVTLDRLLILPHFEVLDARLDALGELPSEANDGSDGLDGEEEETEVQRLIRLEEERGRERLRKRMLKRATGEATRGRTRAELDAAEEAAAARRKAEGGGGRGFGTPGPPMRRRRRRRRRGSDVDGEYGNGASIDGFNGPCVVCLEPDDASRARLVSLRDRLRQDLFPSCDAFSASSSVTSASSSSLLSTSSASSASPLPRAMAERHRRDGPGSTYRPVLTLGRFDTVSEAIELARTIQSAWEPLIFNITDLHVVSRTDDDDKEGNVGGGDDRRQVGDVAASHHLAPSHPRGGRVDDVASLGDERDALSPGGRYGCDAMIMLMGEEEGGGGGGPSDGGSGDLLDLLRSEAAVSPASFATSCGGATNATAVGANLRIDYEAVVRLAEREVARRKAHREADLLTAEADRWRRGEKNGKRVDDDLRHWLDEDDGDGWDEGATIKIGRTRFFLGEMRHYVGMPASSTIDGKDRIMGSGVSAAARRRGAVHRLADRWESGDYGQKKKDYLP